MVRNDPGEAIAGRVEHRHERIADAHHVVEGEVERDGRGRWPHHREDRNERACKRFHVGLLGTGAPLRRKSLATTRTSENGATKARARRADSRHRPAAWGASGCRWLGKTFEVVYTYL
jgi:hypothetical protein